MTEQKPLSERSNEICERLFAAGSAIAVNCDMDGKHGDACDTGACHIKFQAEYISALEAQRDRLAEALRLMEKEKSDYMRLNNLGDPAKEHTNIMARAVLAEIGEK